MGPEKTTLKADGGAQKQLFLPYSTVDQREQGLQAAASMLQNLRIGRIYRSNRSNRPYYPARPVRRSLG